MHFCDTLKIRGPNLDNISLMNSGELHLAVTKRKNINLTLRRIFLYIKKRLVYRRNTHVERIISFDKKLLTMHLMLNHGIILLPDNRKELSVSCICALLHRTDKMH